MKEKLHDARELAKFFEWLEEHTGLEPLSPEAQVLCDQFKSGKLIVAAESTQEVSAV